MRRGACGLPIFSSLQLTSAVPSAPQPDGQFDGPIEHETDPGDYQQAPIEAKRLMLGCGRQVRHEHEEVKQTSEDNSGGLFEEAGEHRALVSSFRFRVSRKTKNEHGFIPMTRIERPSLDGAFLLLRIAPPGTSSLWCLV